MRFMMIVKASEESEAGQIPTEKELAEMHEFNERLVKEGVMLAGEGLHPSSRGVRITYSESARKVTDGPFAETKELVAGFWIIQADSMDDAINWAKQVPFRDGEVEIRQVFEDEDFAASDPTGKIREREARLRSEIADRSKA